MMLLENYLYLKLKDLMHITWIISIIVETDTHYITKPQMGGYRY